MEPDREQFITSLFVRSNYRRPMPPVEVPGPLGAGPAPPFGAFLLLPSIAIKELNNDIAVILV